MNDKEDISLKRIKMCRQHILFLRHLLLPIASLGFWNFAIRKWNSSVEEKSLVTIPAIEKERESVCVCVCVCVRDRERERERETVLQTVRGNWSILKKIVHLK